MTEDVGTTRRKPLSPRERLALWEAHKGVCVVCKLKIQAGDKWIDEHVIPLALGGSNEMSNRGPAHEACAKVKTKADFTAIAKAKRVKQRHLGIPKARKGRSLLGCRDSNVKMKLNGQVVDRRTGKPLGGTHV